MIQDHPIDTDLDIPKPLSRDDAMAIVADLVPVEYHQQAQVLWDTVIAPLYDRQQASQDWHHGKCRRCGAGHPAVVMPRGREVRTNHLLWCPKYVGPITHSPVRTERGFYGFKVLCSCGSSYPEWADTDATIPGTCPDILLVWRGPRPQEPEQQGQ
jgi:hypothetical protein